VCGAANFDPSQFRQAFVDAHGNAVVEGLLHPHPLRDVVVRMFSPRFMATVMLWVMGFGVSASVHQWANDHKSGPAIGDGVSPKDMCRFRITHWRDTQEEFLWQHWNAVCAMVMASTYKDYCSKRGTPTPTTPVTPTDGLASDGGQQEQQADESHPGEEEHSSDASAHKVRRAVRGGAHTRISRHDNTIAEQRPCMSEADCEMHAVCDNRVRRDLVMVMICDNLDVPVQDDGVAREQKGLFFLGRRETPMKEGMWLASFGPVVANDSAMVRALGYAVRVRRGRALAEGQWKRRVEMVTPVPGWQGQYDGAYVNHTCCIEHVNAEFVSTEDYGGELGAPMSTVNVRIIKNADYRDVLTATGLSEVVEEILVHYGSDYKRIVGVCKCCACSQETPECRRTTLFD
jgi:hypothetical protein